MLCAIEQPQYKITKHQLIRLDNFIGHQSRLAAAATAEQINKNQNRIQPKPTEEHM